WFRLLSRDVHGEPTFASPVELDVRWEYRNTEEIDPQGNTIVTNALAVVDRDLSVDDCMWLGELADWLGTGTGVVEAEIMRVASFSKIPDVKGRHYRRVARLQRFRGSL